MRFRGVRVDLEKAKFTAQWLRAEAKKAQAGLPGVDVWSADSIARAFDKAGLQYPRTAAGNPSFTRPWLETQHHPLAVAVLRVRQCEKAANPFVESYILEDHHNGRVHCQFNQLRSDDYGAVSGRFSSSNPNLQNIPARDEVIGPMLRSLFIPEEGCLWRRADYSQIEYRLLTHYAVGPNGEELRERYRKDPKTNYHRMTEAMVLEETGVELGYKPAKNLNFGMVYGMGEDKLTRSLGVSPELGARLSNAYHTAMPSIRATYKAAERLALRRGYIRTILNRRRRFNRFEKNKFNPDREQRAGTHKSLNGLLQGGAADIMKKAMVDCYEAGLFAEDLCGIPHLTVHDELDWSDIGTVRAAEAFAEVEHIMTTGVQLKVPLLLEMSTGANWGDCK
jgi:DNA polymerase I-like protein with 3'-5' exonuclease and polymerase domains